MTIKTRSAWTLGVIAAFMLLCWVPAEAASLTKTLYGFCVEQNCADGNSPAGTLLIDAERHLFGTTARGGQNDAGTIYEIFQSAETGLHRHKVLYDFCNSTGCADGANPVDGSLIMDIDGSLYGTTSTGGTTGGPDGGGVVFKLTPNASKTHWTYSVVYHFCQQASCRDGITPLGNLTYFGAETGSPYDKVSPLYGTTAEGGLHNNGIVFAVLPKTDGSWHEVPLYFFCGKGGTTCADGKRPAGGLAMDSNSSLAGTTTLGGIGDAGVAFKLNNVGKIQWSETVLHQFCSSTDCADGASPLSGLVADGSGNFYGTTVAGGNSNDACGTSGCGVAFKIDTHGLLTTLYSFCSLENCADGGVPARLSLDLTNNPVGMTTVGGAHKSGTLYRLQAGYQDLFDFKCSHKRCSYGKTPAGGVVMDTNNALYSVMSQGGPHNGGTVIKYTPPE